ncbi:hypothetical protein HDV03_001811 [Kappamyces sp. JEL0829]|nr:hypothetical protein HDV03_001811 [Kappamyces sp. JEL0829]
MIAIGGTIGTGLFVGAGATIAHAGPLGALLGFALVGVLVYSIMNSLGELATHLPVSGSFTTYAGLYVDPALSFALGWNYWIQWSVSFPSELSAAGIIMSFWTPTVPSFVWAGAILVILTLVHLVGVKGFGETEYWLSLIKVVAIFCFVITGALVDLGWLGNLAGPAGPDRPLGLQNWFIAGAPFKNGVVGVFKVFLLAFFAFGGTELIGVTAGEAQNPKTTIPRAIRNTFWRILLFYVFSILVMGLVIRNDDPSLLDSSATGDITIAPFTLVFQRAGLAFAAHLMNGVVFSAVLSAGNSALFAASRTLMALSLENKAPRLFSRLSSRGVPVFSILATSLFGCLSFLGIFLGDGVLFMNLIQITGVSGILTWLSIALIHFRFRRAFHAQNLDPAKELDFLAPLFPAGPLIALVLGSVIIAGQAYAASLESIGLLLVTFSGIPLFFGLFLYAKLVRKTQWVALVDVDLTPSHHLRTASRDSREASPAPS